MRPAVARRRLRRDRRAGEGKGQEPHHRCRRCDEATLREVALADEKIVALLDGEPRKVIIVPGRLVNIVP